MSKYPRVIILVTLICKPYTKLSIENNKNNNKFLVNCKHRFLFWNLKKYEKIGECLFKKY